MRLRSEAGADLRSARHSGVARKKHLQPKLATPPASSQPAALLSPVTLNSPAGPADAGFNVAASPKVSPESAHPDAVSSVLHAGISESERFLKGTSQIKTLSADDIEGMRVVSKVRAAVFPPEPDVFPPALILTGGPQLAREVLDIAAMMVKPGATTEEIDHAVHLVFTLSHSLVVSSRLVVSHERRRCVCVPPGVQS